MVRRAAAALDLGRDRGAALRGAQPHRRASTSRARVTTPTLVVHAREDRVVPVEEGRLLAARIPGARFVLLESANHILLSDEPAWQAFRSELRAFLGTRAGAAGDEVATAQPARARRPRARRGGSDQRGDRRAPVPERPHGRAPPLQRLREAARLRQGGARGRRRAVLPDATCRPPARPVRGCVLAPMPGPASARSVVARSTNAGPLTERKEARRWSARSASTPTRPGEPLATREVRGGGGLRLHVREWGDPQGPPIVFVHGWSQSQLCWSRQIAGPLAEDFRIVTFDLRGHGMSEKPPDAEHYLDARPLGRRPRRRDRAARSSIGRCWSRGPTAGSS